MSDKSHLFQPGNPGGPGRPKGARNKLGEDFVRALQQDFKENGLEAVEKVRQEQPAQYLKVIASILPKDINLDVSDELRYVLAARPAIEADEWERKHALSGDHSQGHKLLS